MDKEKIQDEIKELNAIRAMYHREFELIEERYHRHEISEKDLEKHKIKYEKKKEKIRVKIHNLETKLGSIKNID
jgi:hypothetical protein